MKRFAVKSSSTIAVLALASLPLIACGGGGGDDTADDDTTPMGSYTHFVNDTISVPTDSATTRDLGLNIDGDPNNRPDNALGGILAALKPQGVNVQATVAESVAKGSLIILSSVQATSLTS